MLYNFLFDVFHENFVFFLKKTFSLKKFLLKAQLFPI